ncbi:putative fungal-specific transcription factor [Talaromyces proteolyticus]|uniref:Fungal-specific transcription factor n=1 Tax=Talaromyces proteolyticus TaxID=1131652 RepID=A0AAD4PY15_9EURO|nr:putative fungal-specific transcription factor [Talaromyces proteolyticus]KAH8697244.1 putative fungal-specific transcription factor [Talaromyces proteolyticus]
MASESPHLSGSTPQATAASPDGNAKRKAEPSSGTNTRTKRNRYISIACNECKRRKIKCNGQVPCQRCGHLNLECLYAPNCCNGNFKDSEEFRVMKEEINTLQEQVNSLFQNLNNLTSHKAPLDSVPLESFASNNSQSDSIPPSETLTSANNRLRVKHPRFHGPTSSAFNFDVARSSLQDMGIASNEDPMQNDLIPAPVVPSQSDIDEQKALTRPAVMHPSKDPIWSIKREEAIRLCKVYEEEIGLMYPIFCLDKVIAQTNLLYNFLEAADRTGFAQTGLPGLDGLQDDDSLNIKMILATTLVLEGNGQSGLARRLFETVKPIFYSKMLEPVDIKSVQLFTIIATYHFHTDNDILSYRIIGLAARMCLELGLHRRDAVAKVFSAEADRSQITRLFWSVYSLDRRWSFGTGLPFVIQDEDIDPTLPEPDDSLPYLKSMVAYGRLSSKIWYSGLGYEGSTDVKREEIGFLDYQVCQWYKHIPESVMLPVESSNSGAPVNRGLQRLRVLLYLRMNHLRILINRPVLHSASNILENQSHVQMVVNIAKDTIRVLARLNQNSDIYKTQQICFNYFLVAALAVLFLVVCHAPAEFGRQVRDEFYMALNLVNGFTTKSYISKRLWNTIKGVRRIAEKLGVFGRNIGTDASDPHSNAAVAMAGLAGHPIEGLSLYGPPGAISELGSSPMNGLQMSHELTNLFEAVGSSGSFGPDNFNGFIPHDNDWQNSGEGLAGILSGDAEFSRVLRELM